MRNRMKKILKAVVVFVLLTAVSVAAAEGEEAVQTAATVTVTGSASVSVMPDYVTLHLGVNTQGKTVVEAQEINAGQMTAMMEALKTQGIAEDAMHTSHFSVTPIYDYSSAVSGVREKLDGYQVTNTLQVSVYDFQDFREVGAVLDAAMQAGANESYGLTFYSMEYHEMYEEALALAVAEAGRKAQILAGAAGVTLGAPIHISESGGATAGGYGRNNEMMMSAAAGTPITAGEITVEARVEITYQTAE